MKERKPKKTLKQEERDDMSIDVPIIEDISATRSLDPDVAEAERHPEEIAEEEAKRHGFRHGGFPKARGRRVA